MISRSSVRLCACVRGGTCARGAGRACRAMKAVTPASSRRRSCRSPCSRDLRGSSRAFIPHGIHQSSLHSTSPACVTAVRAQQTCLLDDGHARSSKAVKRAKCLVQINQRSTACCGSVAHVACTEATFDGHHCTRRMKQATLRLTSCVAAISCGRGPAAAGLNIRVPPGEQAPRYQPVRVAGKRVRVRKAPVCTRQTGATRQNACPCCQLPVLYCW